MAGNEENVPIEPKKIKLGDILGRSIMFLFFLWLVLLWISSPILVADSQKHFIPEEVITFCLLIPAIFFGAILFVMLISILVAIFFFND